VTQTFFHITFVAVFVAFLVVRAVYQRKATQTSGNVEYKEGGLRNVLRKAVGIPFMLGFLVYMFRPSLFAWAQFSLPAWLQWIGVAMGLASLPLIWWVQWALGSNFSTTLHVRDEHTLVTHGPYQWVRHPMYAVLYVHFIAVLLLTSNWFIGGFFLVALTLVVVTRLKNEEATMIEKFGEDYRVYMRRTGRFFPRLLGQR